MREMYYQLQTNGTRVNRILMTAEILIAYELMTQQSDPAVTTFKDLRVELDATIPAGAVQFCDGFRVVGVIDRVS